MADNYHVVLTSFQKKKKKKCHDHSYPYHHTKICCTCDQCFETSFEQVSFFFLYLMKLKKVPNRSTNRDKHWSNSSTTETLATSRWGLLFTRDTYSEHADKYMLARQHKERKETNGGRETCFSILSRVFSVGEVLYYYKVVFVLEVKLNEKSLEEWLLDKSLFIKRVHDESAHFKKLNFVAWTHHLCLSSSLVTAKSSKNYCVCGLVKTVKS